MVMGFSSVPLFQYLYVRMYLVGEERGEGRGRGEGEAEEGGGRGNLRPLNV
jgi:hypothetical protein